jgi:hypothetical protein
MIQRVLNDKSVSYHECGSKMCSNGWWGIVVLGGRMAQLNAFTVEK